MSSRLVTILLLAVVAALLVAGVPCRKAAEQTRAHKTMEDIEKGMTVMVTFDPASADDPIRRATGVTELIVDDRIPGPNQVEGRLTSIDPIQRLIIVADMHRKGSPETTFRIEPDTVIAIGTEPELTQLSDLGAATILLMGGFRGLAVDVLWLRSIGLHEDRRYLEERAILDIISNLQPNYASVWVFQAWNISYNISVQYDTVEEQFKWVQEGRDFLLKGEKVLPQNADIAFWLGWIYSHKYGSDPAYGELLEKAEGKNNYEEGAYWFDRARTLIEEGRSLSVFGPQVAYSGVFHCCTSRYQQILQESEVGSDGFTPATLEHARPWRERSIAEAGALVKRWPADNLFPAFVARVDTIPVEAYIFHARKAMLDGGLSAEAENRSRMYLNLAKRELAQVSSRYSKKDDLTIIQYSARRLEMLLPTVYLEHAGEVIDGQANPPANKVREAVNWIKRAQALMESARMTDKDREQMKLDLAALLKRAQKMLDSGTASEPAGK